MKITSFILTSLILISGCTPSLNSRNVTAVCKQPWGTIDVKISDGLAVLATKGVIRYTGLPVTLKDNVFSFTGRDDKRAMSVSIPDVSGVGVVSVSNIRLDEDDQLLNMTCFISNQ